MGKIHDALQRAEEERAALARVRGGPGPAEDLTETRPARRRSRRAERAERLREARRSRALLSGVDSQVTEEFRSLRARIQSIRRMREIRSIVVTSALPGEGKTTTATNLALSFGLEREARTCLVDADLRAPAIHRTLPDPPLAGLAELLEADAKLEEALFDVPETRLSVLPVRALPSQPSELLASRRMGGLLQELHGGFDSVIIDSPPILGLPDTTALVDLCDAALLVIKASSCSRRDLEAALERIDATKVLGTVLNRCRPEAQPYARKRRRRKKG